MPRPDDTASIGRGRRSLPSLCFRTSYLLLLSRADTRWQRPQQQPYHAAGRGPLLWTPSSCTVSPSKRERKTRRRLAVRHSRRGQPAVWGSRKSSQSLLLAGLQHLALRDTMRAVYWHCARPFSHGAGRRWQVQVLAVLAVLAALVLCMYVHGYLVPTRDTQSWTPDRSTGPLCFSLLVSACLCLSGDGPLRKRPLCSSLRGLQPRAGGAIFRAPILDPVPTPRAGLSDRYHRCQLLPLLPSLPLASATLAFAHCYWLAPDAASSI